jgi:hypothetical protein
VWVFAGAEEWWDGMGWGDFTFSSEEKHSCAFAASEIQGTVFI